MCGGVCFGLSWFLVIAMHNGGEDLILCKRLQDCNDGLTCCVLFGLTWMRRHVSVYIFMSHIFRSIDVEAAPDPRLIVCLK